MSIDPNLPESGITRRNFLSLATKGVLALSGILGLGGLVRFLGFQTEPAGTKQYNLGPAEGFLPGTRVVVAAGQAILIHDDAGLHAYSLVCPHLGCLVEQGEDGFACPCHGSRFNDDGSLARGPAAEGLRQLRLEQGEEGELILFTQ